MSYTYTYDDGSTITVGDDGTTSATESPTGYLASDYYKNFQPANISPGASSWADVLKYGIGRIADYKTATLSPQNTPATYQPYRVPQSGLYAPQASMMNGNTLLLIGGAVLLFAMLAGRRKRS